MAFTGFVRAARGERLVGGKTSITSDPCSTLREAEEWVSLMLTSNLEAGKRIAEAGTSKQAGTRGKKGKGKEEGADDPRNNTDVENEEAEAATAKPRRRARKAPRHRGANHTPAARADAK